ncbi:MAG TPA: hypothetical protein VHC21_00165 [Candidatus Saccharimonadales bacterium]|nr:hypothetical protein [Candidatus Saccharimonadales bacterium]
MKLPYDNSQFIDERLAATGLLTEAGIREKLITPKEAIVMDRIAQLLASQDQFCLGEVADYLALNPGVVRPLLHQFTAEDKLLESHPDANHPSKKGGRRRNSYHPTELGKMVFAAFEAPYSEF